MAAAQLIAAGLGLYVCMGFLVSVWFVFFAVDRFDPAAHGSSAGFRLLILPGVAALWPLVCLRWLRSPGHD